MKMAVLLGDGGGGGVGGGSSGQIRKSHCDTMPRPNHFLGFLAISAAALVVKCSADPSYCNFETPCGWQGEKDGYVVTTASVIAANTSEPHTGPTEDADGNPNGHFLYYKGRSKDIGHRQVSSPWFSNSLSQTCRMEFMVHMQNVYYSKLSVLLETNNVTSVVGEHSPVAVNSWKQVTQAIGRKGKPFRIILEIEVNKHQPFHAAFDNIALHDCIPDRITSEECNNTRFECEKGICVDRSRVCDLTIDCPGGEDEDNCDVLLANHAYCNFENDTCGWNNSHDDDLEWIRIKGQQNLTKTGPSFDNTYKNASGHYVYLHTIMKRGSLGHKALLNSPLFPPPPKYHRSPQSPYYESCQIRFYYHMHGTHTGDLILNVIEVHLRYESKNQIWRKYQNQGDNWLRNTVTMPKNITRNYYLQFVGTQSYKHLGRIAIDDISMSPECLGIGLPTDEPDTATATNGMQDLQNEATKHSFSTCGSIGRRGPTQQQCDSEYSMPKVTVVNYGVFTGTQQWLITKTAYYSIIARGASGGEGVNSRGPSKGTMVRGVFNLTNGEILHMIVGQEGASACIPYHAKCPKEVIVKRDMNILIKNLNSDGTGGGGGGATYVFKMDENNKPIPLLVAGGGGGLSFNDVRENVSRADGRGENKNIPPRNGLSSPKGAGGGGGWDDKTNYNVSGLSLLEGSVGGETCSGVETWRTFGGFGGGGGACRAGGGGGGYSGGDAAFVDSPNEPGFGGYSYSSGSYPLVVPGESTGPGSVEIFTQFIGCECSHLCVVLDYESSTYGCMCPPGLNLGSDQKSCAEILTKVEDDTIMYQHFLVAIPVTAIILLGIGAVMFFLYQRYRRQTAQPVRQDYSNNHEVQLNRLRPVTGGMMAVTEYNPNYEFGGSICTLQDLKEVPRESLTLIKALGQGAFGEVYQGYLARNPNNEIGGVPVAIKTLPELSSNQAEMDFLMEALIMSKFSHPNIVQFIGVCFEKLPKFIVLELLPGGDLKTFLRESRPKPQKQSTLTMKDLLLLALDVAKGCHYLEENHFIHRDIAARNCLLTSKDPASSRVVKIADFGMARDIYRADYYRKGGKAVLPVKWMPPEAFLDGIFTSKTDIWSFGVLLWEVLSLGYMPYPGRGNQEVMQLVTSGGLLEPPSNCPSPVYRIMTQCWHLIPDERPNFVTILERLGYCIQDPDVINASLPVFHRPPSTERDTTVMRPPDSDNACLQVTRPDNMDHQLPASTDYLIPIPSSNYSLCTEKTDLQSASSVESMDRLLELDDHSGHQQPPQPPCPPTLSMLRPGPLQGQPQLNTSSWGEPNAALVTRSSATPPTPTPTLTPNTTPTASEQSSPNPAAKAAMMAAATTKHWAGYTSIPTHDDASGLASIREGNIARKSPPSNIARQRPSAKQPVTNLSGLSLDPSALVRQNLVVAPLPPPPAPPTTPIPYANVDVAMANTDPYTITTSAVGPGSRASNKNDLKC